MSVAALYDIHGNLAALEAVLAEIPADARIVVGGDVVAGGPQPAETLERLHALGDRVVWIRGNADREGDDAFLHALPFSASLDGVLYVHATPRNDTDIFTERTPEERVAPHFADVEEDVVVVGHTHTQFERVIAGRRVVNAGSVGMPYEDEPGAYWLLDLVPMRTAYDAPAAEATREEAVAHFTERGL